MYYLEFADANVSALDTSIVFFRYGTAMYGVEIPTCEFIRADGSCLRTDVIQFICSIIGYISKVRRIVVFMT